MWIFKTTPLLCGYSKLLPCHPNTQNHSFAIRTFKTTPLLCGYSKSSLCQCLILDQPHFNPFFSTLILLASAQCHLLFRSSQQSHQSFKITCLLLSYSKTHSLYIASFTTRSLKVLYRTPDTLECLILNSSFNCA